MKILIGICQVLTMIELALLLEISMSPGKQRTYERLVKLLRAIVAFISLFAIVSWTIACILVRRPSNEQLEKTGHLLEVTAKVVADGCLIVTVMLMLAISLVIWRLKVK